MLHIYESEYPDDDRIRNAIEVAERRAAGSATDDELAAACAAAGDAVWDAKTRNFVNWLIEYIEKGI